MKFMTEDENDIKWISNPDDYPNIADEVRLMKNAGVWEQFLEQEADENGVVDCDSVYEYLRYDGNDALLSVGLHNNEATATVDDVLKAWEEENTPLKVNRCENGEPSGLDIFDGKYASLDFESVDEDGEIESVSLDNEEVFDLLRGRILCANNATEGAWDSTDPKNAIFEMWRGR